jgi:hypothetical protein
LRKRQLLRLGVGGSKGQVEEFEFQVSSFDCGIRSDYIPQCREREESPPANYGKLKGWLPAGPKAPAAYKDLAALCKVDLLLVTYGTQGGYTVFPLYRLSGGLDEAQSTLS